MPVTFTDERIVQDGEWMFRSKQEDETIEEYRTKFADSQEKKDPVQAHEIRTGKPWNEWSDPQFRELVLKHPELRLDNPMVRMRWLQGQGPRIEDIGK